MESRVIYKQLKLKIMEKTYKVITEFSFGEVYIEHFNTLQTATEVYNKSIEDGCDRCYLLKTETDFQTSGDSCNKILSEYKQE